MVKTIQVTKKVQFKEKGGLVLIAGPCVIEDSETTLRHARKIKKIAASCGVPFIFKSSYDKANRTSIEAFRGPGLSEGLRILAEIKEELGIPVLSDVHCREEVDRASRVLDVIQIPAFLSRQTDLIMAASRTGKVVNVKKGQFLAPWDIEHIIKKIEGAGNRKILITERGSSFGYNNLVSDFRSIPIMRSFGYPVIFDVTHSLQLPGGLGHASGGAPEFIPTLSACAVAAGCDGIFIEVHEQPRRAKCDGPNSLSLNKLEPLLERLVKIKNVTL